MIQLQQAEKTYRSQSGEQTVLHGFDLSIEKGEFVMIEGRSGCGKSTLLNILGLMDTLTAGQYLFEGEDVSAWSGREKSTFRNRRVGFVFQQFHLIPGLSVLENVKLPMRYAKVDAAAARERALALLSDLGMADFINASPARLSGGEKQRVAIARALANTPDLLLADEPTGNLDLDNRDQMMQIFSKIHQRPEQTIVMVTHDRDLLSYADRVIHLEKI